jgi:hypothetical protein
LSIVGLKGPHEERSIGQERLIKRESEQSLVRCRVRLLSEKYKRCDVIARNARRVGDKMGGIVPVQEQRVLEKDSRSDKMSDQPFIDSE